MCESAHQQKNNEESFIKIEQAVLEKWLFMFDEIRLIFRTTKLRILICSTVYSGTYSKSGGPIIRKKEIYITALRNLVIL